MSTVAFGLKKRDFQPEGDREPMDALCFLFWAPSCLLLFSLGFAPPLSISVNSVLVFLSLCLFAVSPLLRRPCLVSPLALVLSSQTLFFLSLTWPYCIDEQVSSLVHSIYPTTFPAFPSPSFFFLPTPHDLPSYYEPLCFFHFTVKTIKETKNDGILNQAKVSPPPSSLNHCVDI